MKNHLIRLLIVLLSLSACKTNKKTTSDIPSGKIILVRHADRDDGVDGLNEQGKKRAKDLIQTLKGEKIAAVFCTEYKRTQETAQPICAALNIPAKYYSAGDILNLSEKIKKEYPGETVLVVGHGNTVPSFINLFNIENKLNDIDHHQYSLLFTLDYGKKDEVKISKYGEVID